MSSPFGIRRRSAKDVGETVAWLGSGRTSYATDLRVPVDGGFFAQYRAADAAWGRQWDSCISQLCRTAPPKTSVFSLNCPCVGLVCALLKVDSERPRFTL